MYNLIESVQKKVMIVAEIGKNFIQTEEERPVAEYLENAKALVASVKEAGADAVKFQTHHVEDEVLPIKFDSPHFKGKSRYDWVLRNERATPRDDFWKPLRAYCEQIGVIFFSTPMSRGAARKLETLDVPFWKVASSDILDFPMLDLMAETNKPIMVPSGMSTLADIDASIAFLKKRNAQFVLMHAISRYPYPPEDSNLRAIIFFQKRYPDVLIGFSQNSPWIEPAVVAVAFGSRIVEQHFTFDRTLWGPDHKVSMTPDEFKKMAAGIRRVEYDQRYAESVLADSSTKKYLGTEDKILQDGEIPFRGLFRKGLVAGRDLPVDTVLAQDMIYAMRPQQYAGALPSEKYMEVLGKTITRALKKYDPITAEVLG